MKPKAVVILAEGFEEMEAVISIDLLRRAGVEVLIAGISDEAVVKGSRGICVQTQTDITEINQLPDALVLPGGMPGAVNLENSEPVIAMVRKCFDNNKIVAAICASPAHALVRAGILAGRAATCYPGAEKLFPEDVRYVDDGLVIDGNIITATGPGTGFDFALAVIEALCGKKIAEIVKKNALIR